MARATYIYVLLQEDGFVAAWTVKHEMVRWLKNHWYRSYWSETAILRSPDGGPKSAADGRKQADITKDIRKLVEAE